MPEHINFSPKWDLTIRVVQGGKGECKSKFATHDRKIKYTNYTVFFPSSKFSKGDVSCSRVNTANLSGGFACLGCDNPLPSSSWQKCLIGGAPRSFQSLHVTCRNCPIWGAPSPGYRAVVVIPVDKFNITQPSQLLSQLPDTQISQKHHKSNISATSGKNSSVNSID